LSKAKGKKDNMRLSRAFALLATLALLLALLPIIFAFAAAGVAEAWNCNIDEGSVQPCVVMGVDIRETLYAMGVSIWLMLVTILYIPVAAVLAVASVGQRHRERKGIPTSSIRWTGLLFAIAGLAFPVSFGIALMIAAVGALVLIYLKWRTRS
jgi:hypothetical protein